MNNVDGDLVMFGNPYDAALVAAKTVFGETFGFEVFKAGQSIIFEGKASKT